MTDAAFYRLAVWGVSAAAVLAVVALVWCVYRIVELTDDERGRRRP